MPKIEIVYLPVDNLRPPERKTRKADPAHTGEVADSISRLGFCVPVLIEADNRLIDGNVRWEAARQLGLETIPFIRVQHLSKNELRALRLALNRLGEKGEWDVDELRLEIQELVTDDAPIEIIGFSGAEIVGSGSALLACEKAGRTCHGVEIDPLYVDLTIRPAREFPSSLATRQSEEVR